MLSEWVYSLCLWNVLPVWICVAGSVTFVACLDYEIWSKNNHLWYLWGNCGNVKCKMFNWWACFSPTFVLATIALSQDAVLWMNTFNDDRSWTHTYISRAWTFALYLHLNAPILVFQVNQTCYIVKVTLFGFFYFSFAFFTLFFWAYIWSTNLKNKCRKHVF